MYCTIKTTNNFGDGRCGNDNPCMSINASSVPDTCNPADPNCIKSEGGLTPNCEAGS